MKIFLLIVGIGIIKGQLETQTQYFKTTSAAYFKPHSNVATYETSAKLLFEVKMPQFEALPPGDCAYHDPGCWAEIGILRKKKEMNDFIWNLTSTVKLRKKRQVLIGALAAFGGYALHEAFSSIGNHFFGTDNQANQHINTVWNSMVSQRKDFLLFREQVEDYSKNLSLLVGRNWFFDNELAKQNRRIFYFSQFVTPDLLKNRLEKISVQAKIRGYSLAIPSSSIGAYQKLKISDCFMSNTTMYILLNIPMTTTKWNIFEFIPVPFAFDNQTCGLESESIEIVAIAEKSINILSSMDYSHCDLIRQKLCYVSTLSRPSKISSSCAMSLYNHEDLEQISHSCTFKCKNKQKLITFAIDTNTLIVTNAKSLKVTCKNQTRSFNPVSVGSLELFVTCNCSYIIDDEAIDTRNFCFDKSFHSSDVQLTLPKFLFPANNSNSPLVNDVNKIWTNIAPTLRFSKYDDSFIAPIPIPNEHVGIYITALAVICGFLLIVVVVFIFIFRSIMKNFKQ